MEHKINTEQEDRTDGGQWYRTRCSCGKYLSGIHTRPGDARRAASVHVRTMAKQEKQ